MRQNEIIHEKELYKLTTKCKEYKYIIHEQKNSILEMDTELNVKKHLESIETSKIQMQNTGEDFIYLEA